MTRIIAVVGLALILLFGTMIFSSAQTNAGTPQTVENESFTPDGGTVTTLANSHLEDVVYNNTVTVYNNSSVVDPAGNYTWYSRNGTLRTQEGSYLASKSEANITYGWTAVSSNSSALASLFASGIEIVHALTIVVALGTVLAALRILGGV